MTWQWWYWWWLWWWHCNDGELSRGCFCCRFSA